MEEVGGERIGRKIEQESNWERRGERGRERRWEKEKRGIGGGGWDEEGREAVWSYLRTSCRERRECMKDESFFCTRERWNQALPCRRRETQSPKNL